MASSRKRPSGDSAGTGKTEPVPDPILEAMIESFPASDPPSWMGTRVGAPPGREGGTARRRGDRRKPASRPS